MTAEELSSLFDGPFPAVDHEAARAMTACCGASASSAGTGPFGRLGRFLIWWASVRGEHRVTVPGSVVLCRPPAPSDHPVSGPRVPGGTSSGNTAEPRTAVLPDRDDVREALRWSHDQVDDWAAQGVELVLLALGDPVAARVVAAHLLGLDPIEVNDWPRHAGIDDPTWMSRTARIRDGLRRIRRAPRQPTPVLTALGDGTVAAATGLLARCAAHRIPVLLDGPGATAAAFLARTAAPAAAAWWQAAQVTCHPVHSRLLTAASWDPVLDLGIRAENGTGSMAALTLLEFALRLPCDDDDGGNVPTPDEAVPGGLMPPAEGTERSGPR